MASIVGCVAFSHSPFWDLSFDISGPGEDFIRGVAQAREIAKRLKPDAFVIFGPDHFRNFFFFYDVLPPFCIGVNEVEGIGDYGLPKRALPSAAALGAGIYQHVIEHGFDPAVSMRMGVDHGITQLTSCAQPGYHYADRADHDQLQRRAAPDAQALLRIRHRGRPRHRGLSGEPTRACPGLGWNVALDTNRSRSTIPIRRRRRATMSSMGGRARRSIH